MNQVQIVGRLGREPNFGTNGNDTDYAFLSIATNHKYKASDGTWAEKADWHRAVVHNGKARYVRDVPTGTLVEIVGHLTYTTREVTINGKKTKIQEALIKAALPLCDPSQSAC